MHTSVNFTVSPSARALFDQVWESLEKEINAGHLVLPQRVFWLNGAPGAGKGTHTEFIRRKYALPAPVGVSDLLKSDEARKIINTGALVGDREVTELVFHRLLSPEFSKGVIVDGYPRTLMQAECVKLFFEKAREHFPSVKFHVLVLLVDEDVSVARQMHRGKEAMKHNANAAALGAERIEVRATDLDPATAAKRYGTFMRESYASLQSLGDRFPFQIIDAGGTIPEVSELIVAELERQDAR